MTHREAYWLVLAGLALAGCSPNISHVTVRRESPIGHIHRVVILPFTDDPFLPCSGFLTAAAFRTEAQLKIKTVEWVGPELILRQEGLEKEMACDQNPVSDLPNSVEPILGQILQSTGTLPAINPVRDLEIGRRNRADAVVRGAVFYDLGTGVMESLVTPKRQASSALSLQMMDTAQGEVFLAFNQTPAPGGDHPVLGELLRATAEAAVRKIEKSWR